jgi:hypothetical protein
VILVFILGFLVGMGVASFIWYYDRIIKERNAAWAELERLNRND